MAPEILVPDRQVYKEQPSESLSGGAAPLRTPSGLRAAGLEATEGQLGSPAYVERLGAALEHLTNKDLTLQPRRSLTLRFSLSVSPRKGAARAE